MPSTSIVIGAGIVGLHTACILREAGHEVYVLEQAPYLAEHTSGRNSGVIHAGIFYKADSFKEKVCIEGNRLTYEWLERLKVPYRPCGKWVVPEEGQKGELESFFERIRKLPIPSPLLKSPAQVQVEESCLRPIQAVLIPSTGVLDAASYVKALAAHVENQGVKIILNCQVREVGPQTLKTSRGDISFDLAVNSAGLFADEIANMTGVTDYEIRPCRGDYYLLPKKFVKRPVYHLPYQGRHGLGIHLTPTIDDQTLVGPNAFFIETKTDYEHRSDPSAYEKAIRHHIPSWNGTSLSPAYSGNRPKLYFKGEALDEFTILQNKNWIHLLGIESPGLTAAPAIANHLLNLL